MTDYLTTMSISFLTDIVLQLSYEDVNILMILNKRISVKIIKIWWQLINENRVNICERALAQYCINHNIQTSYNFKGYYKYIFEPFELMKNMPLLFKIDNYLFMHSYNTSRNLPVSIELSNYNDLYECNIETYNYLKQSILSNNILLFLGNKASVGVVEYIIKDRNLQHNDIFEFACFYKLSYFNKYNWDISNEVYLKGCMIAGSYQKLKIIDKLVKMAPKRKIKKIDALIIIMKNGMYYENWYFIENMLSKYPQLLKKCEEFIKNNRVDYDNIISIIIYIINLENKIDNIKILKKLLEYLPTNYIIYLLKLKTSWAEIHILEYIGRIPAKNYILNFYFRIGESKNIKLQDVRKYLKIDF